MAVNRVIFSIFGAYPSAADDHGSPVFIVLAIICAQTLILTVYGSIFPGVKRRHDYRKSGAWTLVQRVPAIDAFSYFIEAGCLKGAIGPDRYGPDPLGASSQVAAA